MAKPTTTITTPPAQQDAEAGVLKNGDNSIGERHVEYLKDDCVLIAGGGPVGLVLATVLSYYGIRSVILERNATTTK